MAVNATFGRKVLKSPVGLHSKPLECTAEKIKITHCKKISTIKQKQYKPLNFHQAKF
jgi:hypothetical protein